MPMKWYIAVTLVCFLVFISVFGVQSVYSYFFPIRYEEEVAFACEKFDVEKAEVFSIINIESGFNCNAKSNMGAVGLMQLMPKTASEMAQKLGLASYDLEDAGDNILIGTYYFKLLKNRFQDERVALCAYNAGPTNVTAWLSKEEYSDDGKTLKKIPFKETREYVLRFERNLRYYSTKNH